MTTVKQAQLKESVKIYWEEGDLCLLQGEDSKTRFYQVGRSPGVSLDTRMGQVVSVLIDNLGKTIPRSWLRDKTGIDQDREVVYALGVQFSGSSKWELYTTRGKVRGVIGIVPREYQLE